MKTWANYLPLIVVFGVSACSFLPTELQQVSTEYPRSGTMILAQTLDRRSVSSEVLLPLIGFGPDALLASSESSSITNSFANSGSIILAGSVATMTREEMGPILSYIPSADVTEFDKSGSVVLTGTRNREGRSDVNQNSDHLVPVLGFVPQPW